MPPARKSIQKQAAKPAAKNLNRAGAAKGKGKARAPPVTEPEPEPEPESDPDPSDDDDDDFEIGDAEEEEDEEDEVSDVASEDPEYPDDLSSVYPSPPPPPRSPDQLTEKQLLVELVKATNTNNDLLKGVVTALSTTTPNTAPPSAAAQPRSREPDSASFILTPSKDSLGRFRDPAFVKSRHARRSRLHNGQVREPPGVVDGPGPLPDHLAHPPQDPRAEPWVWRAPHAGGRLARAVAALSAFGACWHSLPRPAEAWGVGGGHQGSRARGGRTQPKGGAAHGAHRREGDP